MISVLVVILLFSSLSAVIEKTIGSSLRPLAYSSEKLSKVWFYCIVNLEDLLLSWVPNGCVLFGSLPSYAGFERILG